ncbi:MAG: hypothetical protein KF878_24940 [Planctomycetes bacterium]|nr:hypothetical protein [Planctomycetota bacterium]
MWEVDALDVERSEPDCVGDLQIGVKVWHFLPDRVRPLFRVPQAGDVLCDEATRRAIEDAGLTGFAFELLWEG